jgi:hypothetical protein
MRLILVRPSARLEVGYWPAEMMLIQAIEKLEKWGMRAAQQRRRNLAPVFDLAVFWR